MAHWCHFSCSCELFSAASACNCLSPKHCLIIYDKLLFFLATMLLDTFQLIGDDKWMHRMSLILEAKQRPSFIKVVVGKRRHSDKTLSCLVDLEWPTRVGEHTKTLLFRVKVTCTSGICCSVILIFHFLLKCQCVYIKSRNGQIRGLTFHSSKNKMNCVCYEKRVVSSRLTRNKTVMKSFWFLEIETKHC